MKKLICITILTGFLFSESAFSQVSYDLEFKDGKKKTVVIDYDNPYTIPKLRIGVGAIGVAQPEEGVFTIDLHPEYRVNNKLSLDANFTVAYGKSVDGNISKNHKGETQFRPFKNHNVMAHYNIIGGVTVKNKKLAVDWAYDAKGNKTYIMRAPRNLLKVLAVDLGINSFGYTVDKGIRNSSSAITNSYYAASYNSTSLQYGISFYKSQSYKITTNGLSRSYFRYYRAYFNFLSAFNNNVSIYERLDNRSDVEVVQNGNMEAITQHNFGYRLGFINHFGFKNSGNALWIRYETGMIPHYKYTSNVSARDQFVTSDFVVMVNIGLSFGAKPTDRVY